MTTIQCQFKNANSENLAGYILVGLDSWLMKDGDTTSYAPKTARIEFVAGACTLDLAPSDLEQVTYNFEVWYYDSVTTTDPVTGDPIVTITNTLLVPKFYARVPYSATPILFNDLAKQSGINRDNIDTAISAITKRLYNDDLFWTRLQENIFVARGDYSSTAWYSRGDVVTWNGGSYLYYNSERTQGTLPSTTTYWQKLADRGATGAGTTGNDAPFDAGWDGQTDAPSRNAVYDQLQLYALASTVSGLAPLASPVFSGNPTRSTTPSVSSNDASLANTAWVQTVLATVAKAIVPVGSVVAYCGSSAPTGWVLCDGRTLSRTTYANLFAILSTTYNTGGELGTEFRVPDLRGRVLFAPDNMGITGTAGRLSGVTTLNASGGAQRVTLAVTEMPSHSHNPATGFSTFYGAQTGGTGTIAAGTNYGAMSATATAGGGASHENMPPYLTSNYIIYSGL